MFLRIFYSILLIGIVNEMCHAERLLGCKKFSDRPQGPPAGPQEIVVLLNSDPTLDVNFIPVVVAPALMPAYLVLESCEKDAKAHDVMNKTTLLWKAKKYRDQIKGIRIDFGPLENNCFSIVKIKSKIEKILFPKPTKPTLYVDLTKNTITIKKAIKRLLNGDYRLVDDCKTNVGYFTNLTKIIDLVKKTAKGVREAVKIEFTSENKFCQPIKDIAKTILGSLKSKYSTIKAVTDLPDPIELPSTIDEGTHVIYKNGKFALVNGCKTKMSIKLGTAAELEDVLDKIANSQIERVNAKLRGMKN